MLTDASFDWARGTYETSPAAAETSRAEATLCIAGDWAPIRLFKQVMESDPCAVYGDLLPVLQDTDLRIVNLECPLSDRGAPVHKSGAVFKGEQKHIHALNCVPFNVATLANNHVMDYGITAFKDTLALLDRHNIRRLGAGLCPKEAGAPLIHVTNDIRIGIVNFSEGEDLTAAGPGPGVMGWDLTQIEETVKQLRETVDFVVVISHCGIEYIPFPPPYVQDAFRQLARAGADLVIGHHPHVPQGIEFYENTPICYSLGNFAFYQPTGLKHRKLGYLVKLAINKRSIASFDIIPYEITDRGLGRLKADKKDTFLQKFKQISFPIKKTKKLEETWHAFLDYYGVDGFFNEISMIMDKMKTEPQKGAAMFRNRLTTRQHFYHWKDFLTRGVKNQFGTSPDWARDLIEEYFTEKLLPETKG